MGKLDTYAKDYVSKNNVFADIINYAVYDGEKYIHEVDLEELDVTEISIPYSDTNKQQVIFPVQKIRDVLKLYASKETKQAQYLIFGIENQAAVHYAMPVRNMLYDALNYASQTDKLAIENRKRKKVKSKDEFLSGLGKNDKLKPVVTVVVYWGTKKWDGPRCLHDMLEADSRTLRFVNDYRFPLIVPNEIEDFSKFSTEFGAVMRVIKAANDKTALRELILRDETYKSIPVAVARLLEVITSKKFVKQEEGGDMDMCEGMKGIIEDARQEGILEGRQEARQEILEIAKNLLKENESVERVMRLTGLSEDELTVLLEEK